jgi:hypothetical protein
METKRLSYAPSRHRFAVHLVLQGAHAGFPVPVDMQVICAVHPHVVVVAAIQVDDVLAPLPHAWGSRERR